MCDRLINKPRRSIYRPIILPGQAAACADVRRIPLLVTYVAYAGLRKNATKTQNGIGSAYPYEYSLGYATMGAASKGSRLEQSTLMTTHPC
eukprot:scaffold54848_cov46-Attheya_sp.AAC.2